MKDRKRTEAYKKYIVENIQTVHEIETSDDKWKQMANLCKKSAEENFGSKKTNQRTTHNNPEIMKLSDE